MSHECGPQCRPSCVTLMLDLEKLAYESQVTCTEGELCHCAHSSHPSSKCSSGRLEALFDHHPKCYLEDADCLGPTLYDNKVKRAIDLQPSIDQFTSLQQCDSLPDEDLYCRFQDWKVINPIEKERCRDGSFPDCIDESKIYWEYCNIVEEDPACDRDEECRDGDRCGRRCPKITEPFPPGWTTFVVSGAIPFRPEWNPVCADQLPLADATNSACFLQRVEVYYPPEDEDCGIGCPHCHDCPLLSVGDKFGPLEVVGLNRGLHNDNDRRNHHGGCSSCDDRGSLSSCQAGEDWKCRDGKHLPDCSRATNCFTNEVFGLGDFVDNQCTFDNVSLEGNINTSSSGDRGFAFAVQEEQHAAAVETTLDPAAVRTLIALLVLVLLAVLAVFFRYGWGHWTSSNEEKTPDLSQRDSETDEEEKSQASSISLNTFVTWRGNASSTSHRIEVLPQTLPGSQ